jgi:hypothetical protein
MDTTEKPASRQIDDIISNISDWRGTTLAELRATINQSDASIVEEVKWKKPSRPEGVPVWSESGNICIAEPLKNAVRLTFPKGAQLKDASRLFNTRLDSKTIRAIDFFEDTRIDEARLKALIVEAVQLNISK